MAGVVLGGVPAPWDTTWLPVVSCAGSESELGPGGVEMSVPGGVEVSVVDGDSSVVVVVSSTVSIVEPPSRGERI
ncbi:MAG TPA: hypothetical protein VGJ86_21325 [Acidimicrobiales bacterium]